MRKYLYIATSGILAAPVMVFAQDFNNLETLISGFGGVVSTAAIVVIGLAVLALFWGVAKYILNAGDEEAKKEGRSVMIAAIIGLTVAVSIWAIVNFIQQGFFGETSTATPPTDIENLIPKNSSSL